MMENNDLCLEDNLTCSDDKIDLLNEQEAYNLADFYKVFADKTRIRILHLISKEEICVHEIANILEMSQSSISHQLKMLRQANLVSVRKVGKHVYYQLADNHVLDILKNGLDHIQE